MAEQTQRSIFVDAIGTDKELVVAAMDNACNILNSDRFRVFVKDPMAVLTITEVAMLSLIDALSRKEIVEGEATINFQDIFAVGKDLRLGNEETEKDGNITPFISPGYRMKVGVKSDRATESLED